MGVPDEGTIPGWSVERLGLYPSAVYELRAAGLETSEQVREFLAAGGLNGLSGRLRSALTAAAAAIRELPAGASEPVDWRRRVVAEMWAGGHANELQRRWNINGSTLNELLDEAGRPKRERERGKAYAYQGQGNRVDQFERLDEDAVSVVALVELGVSVRDVARAFEVSTGVLRSWLGDFKVEKARVAARVPLEKLLAAVDEAVRGNFRRFDDPEVLLAVAARVARWGWRSSTVGQVWQETGRDVDELERAGVAARGMRDDLVRQMVAVGSWTPDRVSELTGMSAALVAKILGGVEAAQSSVGEEAESVS